MRLQEQTSFPWAIALQRLVLRLLLALLVFLGVIWGSRYVRLSPLLSKITWLRIDEVRITTQWPLEEATVRAWLPSLRGESILSVRAVDVVDALIHRPWVEGVTLQKQYPNRIVVDVTTKRASAVLIVKGEPHFIDGEGRLIERATPRLLSALDLPVITIDKRAIADWSLGHMLSVLDKIQRAIEPDRRVSEMALDPAPVFRVFTQPSRIELVFSLDTWEAQLPNLLLLLRHPPPSLGQPQKINLIFPKKTIVSSPESK